MKNLILFIVIAFSTNLLAQPPGSQVFNDTVLHNLVIETDLPNWFDTLERDFDRSFADPERFPEVYHKCKVNWDGIELNGCGFREKGNSSNSLITLGKKKPFKISFDEFENHQLDGLKKINLNNFTNDPSLMRDAIALKLFRDQGLVAPRTSYTKLWINGEYIGLYIVIENVDKKFLKFHYGSTKDDGNLYKTDRGAAVFLNWLGAESKAYKDKGLKLTTNESLDDWGNFIRFIGLINNNHSPDFKQRLEKSFDVHSYLKILAIEKCIRNFDSYWGGGNNFYLYEHPNGVIRWIPWDLNETFIDLKRLSGTSLMDGYLVPANKYDDRPLLKRIFEFEGYKTEYLDNVCELIQTKFTTDYLGKYILTRHNLIAEAYKEDPYRWNSYEAFENSLTGENLDEVSLTKSGYVLRMRYPGIYPFIQSQRKWAVEQMEGWDYTCTIENSDIYKLKVFPNPASDEVNISNDSAFDYSQFKLYDLTGKLILNTNFELKHGGYFALPLGSISPGMYLIMKSSADGRIGRAKVIVK